MGSMQIVIVGAGGMLGRDVAEVLGERYPNTVCATRHEIDITDYWDTRWELERLDADAVVNCAAFTDVDGCETETEKAFQVNAEGAGNLARACAEIGARVLHVSTDFVFDGENGPYREEDRPRPVNFYGKAKLASENAAREAGRDKWAIVRTVLVYGAGEALRRANIALWVIDKLSKGEVINVVTDQWRTPTYAPDLAAGIEQIVRFNKTGIYHVSGRELVSIYAFAQTIARVFDLDASLIHPTDGTQFRQKAARPPRTGFIILKAETELGYKPRTLETALGLLGARLGLPATTSR